MKCPVVTLVAFCLLLASCKTVYVEHDFSPEVDLMSYQTFALLPSPHDEFDENAFRILGEDNFALKEAAKVVQQKGFSLETGEDVDFFIRVRKAWLKQKIIADAPVSSEDDLLVMRGWDIATPPSLPGYSKTGSGSELGKTSRKYSWYSFIIVEVFDSSTRKVVWHGWAKSLSSKHFNTDEKRAKAIHEILSTFPN
ncbi:DUF4136 domain-containing protein [Pelagicoccus sp. SDUM812003]|uniref:DUF4136 domain-containing protein n=1 Tax=Pelagicoccus sp. SDUM812003 TaxID=3041267 RepID=UPI00280D9FCD|nr:DUF4136 domain-containing protein [Pelagicoccus sp. SDUM812003]MDQ8204879.1 DUF4136 domain-containing protein [Pelagicoccus sp. SDUM812003]